MRPETAGTDILSIDEFCKSPLLHFCIRAQQQNNTRFYLPVDTSVVLLECIIQSEQDISLRKSVVSFQCNLNDLVIASGSLLVACRPLASNNTCVYLYNHQCEIFPQPHFIETLLADPVVLPDAEESGEGRVVSVSETSSGINLIIFSTSYSLRTYSIPDDCQAPLKLSRQESAILLACTNATQYMINITNLLPRFFCIDSATHGSLLALSSNGYALFSSQLQLTLQDITSEHAVTISIDRSHGSPVYADFTYNGAYAFVATNVTVIFIHVTQALRSHDPSENFYFYPVQICYVCPSVQFINSTMAVVSSMDDEYNVMLRFLMFDQWPPYLFISKILPGFPRQYWFLTDVPREIVLPTTVTTDTKITLSVTKNTATTTSMDTTPTTTSSPSNTDGSDSESDMTTIIIVIITVCLFIFITAVILLLVAFPMYKKWKQGVQSRSSDNHTRITNPTATATTATTNAIATAPVNATAVEEQHSPQSTTLTVYNVRDSQSGSPAATSKHQ